MKGTLELDTMEEMSMENFLNHFTSSIDLVLVWMQHFVELMKCLRNICLCYAYNVILCQLGTLTWPSHYVKNAH